MSRRGTWSQTCRDLPSIRSHIHDWKAPSVYFYHHARETTSQHLSNSKRVKLKRKFEILSYLVQTHECYLIMIFQTKLLTPGTDILILKFPLTVSSICQGRNYNVRRAGKIPPHRSRRRRLPGWQEGALLKRNVGSIGSILMDYLDQLKFVVTLHFQTKRRFSSVYEIFPIIFFIHSTPPLPLPISS